MKKINRILKITAFILTVSIFSNCNQITMTNQEAQALIVNTLSLPQGYREDIEGNSGDPLFKGARCEKLRAEGFIVMHGSYIGGYKINITDKGKPFFLGKGGKDMYSEDILKFKTYDIDFDKITGISINKEQQTATIRFSLKAIHITPIGRAMRNDLDNLFNGELNFKKFDNGWQLEYDQNKSATELVSQITKEGQGVTNQNVPEEREKLANGIEKQVNDQSLAKRHKMAEDEAKRKMDSLFYVASQSMTTVVDQVDNAHASNETNFNNIQSFFSFFKQAVADNDKEKLYKYLDHSSSWTKSKFIKEYQFSSFVRKLIIGTSLPVYSNENQSYSIQGNDNETGEAMLFSIVFKKGEKVDWTWDMIYFD
ncbi:MAG: hypothetical protein WAV23_02940 [Minisyncoccia bacterium]